MPTATHDSRRPFWRSRWWMPGFCVAIGAVTFAAFAIGGDAGSGVISLAVLAAAGAAFLFGTRSETLQGLGGPSRDERWAMIDVHATALTGLVLIVVLIGAWLWEIAHGRDGSPYGQLCAVGGIAYVAAIALLRRRA